MNTGLPCFPSVLPKKKINPAVAVSRTSVERFELLLVPNSPKSNFPCYVLLALNVSYNCCTIRGDGGIDRGVVG